MSEKIRVTKAASIVGAATFLSRIFGFIRDVVVAWYFGAGMYSDAFFVAFRIPNLLRRLFAEGSLSIAFIPIFTEYLETRGRAEAFDLARSALKVLAIILVVVSIVGIVMSPMIVRVIAPGFSSDPEKFEITVFLTQLVFPYVFFICLVALCMGILNVLGHFAAPALAPVFLNIAMIASVVYLSPFFDEAITALGVGVLIGGFLQLLLQLPFLIRNGVYFWRKSTFFHPGLKRIVLLMGPAVFGAAVYQINILVGTLLASLLPEGSVSYLYYADRLVQFPLGIFAIATATAVLPSLSRQAAVKNYTALKETFGHALNLVFFITIPAMVGLIVLREPIVALLFRRGAFDFETTRLTADALLYYSIGLWAFSAVRIAVSTFYAIQDTKTPVKMAIVSITANIVLAVVLMKPFLHGGLALATSISSIINLGLLIVVLRMRLGPLGLGVVMKSLLKSCVSAIFMGYTIHFAAARISASIHSISFEFLFLQVVLYITAGFVLYFSTAYLLKSQELQTVLSLMKKRSKIG